MSVLIDVILPVFLVIGFGYVVAWRGLFSEGAVDGLMRFAQNFAVPVLLARSIANLDLTQSYNWAMMAAFYSGALISFAIGITGARMIGRNGPESVAIGFACLFSDSDEYETALIAERRAQGRYQRPRSRWPVAMLLGVMLMVVGAVLLLS